MQTNISTADKIVSAVHEIIHEATTTNVHNISDQFVADTTQQISDVIHTELSFGGTANDGMRSVASAAETDEFVDKVMTERLDLQSESSPKNGSNVGGVEPDDVHNEMEQNMDLVQSKVDDEIGKEISKSTHDPIAALADILEPETRAIYTKDIPGMQPVDGKVVNYDDDVKKKETHDEAFEYAPLKDTSGYLIEDTSAATSRIEDEQRPEEKHVQH